MYSFTAKENQYLYVNDSFISGVQSVSINNNQDINSSFEINGTGNIFYISNLIEPIINISYIPTNRDFFINFTGNNPISGAFHYLKRFFNFTSGYLDRYSISQAIDSPIISNVSIKSYGPLAETTGISSTNILNYNITPYDLNYTNISINNYININRVQSFSLDINCPKVPNYEIGNFFPSYVSSALPFEVNFNSVIEMSEYNITNIRSYFSNMEKFNLKLSFKQYETNTESFSLSFNDLIKSDESFDFTIDEYGKANISFKTYILY